MLLTNKRVFGFDMWSTVIIYQLISYYYNWQLDNSNVIVTIITIIVVVVVVHNTYTYIINKNIIQYINKQ